MVRSLFKSVAAMVVALCAVFVLSLPASAQESRPRGVGPPAPFQTGILINLPARTLYWYQNGSLVRSFPVAIGAASSPTPTGRYVIQNKAVDPWWLPPDGRPIVAPGPANPLGTRWMAFNGAYGIHGNNNPSSIGQVVSAGCVRMYKEDVEWLYDQVWVGLPVHVVYERVQIQHGPDGQTYLAIFPDVYGRGGKTPAQVLAAAGFDPSTVTSTQAGLYPLKSRILVNGEEVDSLLHDGRPYLAARRLGEIMRAEIDWNAATSRVLVDGVQLATVLHAGSGYVDAAEAAEVLGVSYTRAAGMAKLEGVPLVVNGQLVNRQGVWLDGELYVPTRVMAVAAGAMVTWDHGTRSVLVNGQVIPYQMLGATSHVKLGDLAWHLGMGWWMENGVGNMR